MKKLSLIVPVYNAEEFLRDFARSVLSQDYENFQLIFSDDGSTDGSPTILQSIAAQDERVTVVSGANAGVSTARNRALALAEGDYIGFSDSDDILEPGYLSYLVSLLEEYGTDAACCGFSRTYAASGVTDYMPPKGGEIQVTDRDGFLEKMLRPDGYTSVLWNKLFRREALLESTGRLLMFNESLYIVEDGEYLFRSNVQSAAFSPKPLYRYFVRTSGAMYGRLTDRKKTEFMARQAIVDLCGNASREVQILAKMKYQKGVRDTLFHAVLSGQGGEIGEFFPNLRIYRRELYRSPALSGKEKLKYRVYPLIIRLNLRGLGAFLMKTLSGHG